MLWVCGRQRSRRTRLLNREKLEQTTDIFITDTTMDEDDMQGYEACLTDPEDKKFVGTTATFDQNWDIIPLRPDLRLGGYTGRF
jgi:hypothetical protein